MDINNIVFDFDGVLVDSNNIKRDSFFRLFPDKPGAEELTRRVYQENIALIKAQQITRKELIREYVGEFVRQKLIRPEDVEEEYERNLQLYSQTVDRMILEVPEIAGASDALTVLHTSHNLYVLSTTPQENLTRTIQARGLEKFFRAYYGASGGFKIDMFARLVQEHGVYPSKTIFVGDGSGDLECALYYKLPFIGIVNPTNDFGTNPQVKYRLPDLTVLVRTIEEMEGLTK